MVMKIVRMREERRRGRLGGVCDRSRTATSTSSSSVLGIGVLAWRRSRGQGYESGGLVSGSGGAGSGV